MRVLVACEYSGRVREAFRRRGHDAQSCDLLQAEDESENHFQADMWDVVYLYAWDMVIAHPECTFHTNASVRWFTTIPEEEKPGVFYGDARWEKWGEAVDFFQRIQAIETPKLCIENPIMHGYSLAAVGPYTQKIQPWMFGHMELKATCLWLRGLPKLVPTNVLTPPKRKHYPPTLYGEEEFLKEHHKWSVVHRATPGPDRWKDRSRTYQGIADAMAAQWG